MTVIFFLSLVNSNLLSNLYYFCFPKISILIESDSLSRKIKPSSFAASRSVISSGEEPWYESSVEPSLIVVITSWQRTMSSQKWWRYSFCLDRTSSGPSLFVRPKLISSLINYFLVSRRFFIIWVDSLKFQTISVTEFLLLTLDLPPLWLNGKPYFYLNISKFWALLSAASWASLPS